MSLVSKISRQKIDALIEPHATNERVLDIGAYGMPSYAKYFSNRVGIDMKAGPGVDIVGSVYELPFNDNEFDTVLCLSVLEHLEDPAKALLEIRRVLKLEGKIIISVPFMFPIHDAPGDYWRFTKFGLRKLFSKGWSIQQLQAETTTEETFAVLFQRLGYQTKMRANNVSKVSTFLIAKFFEKIHIVKKVFGDIKKTTQEPEAFASAFFLVATKL